MSSLLLLSVITFFGIGSSAGAFCDQSYECEGQSLIASESAHIQGYKSLFGPRSSCTANDSIYANGAYACDGASFLRTSYSYVLCYGSGSCSNTQITVADGSILYCTAVNSCSFSTISAFTLNCDGDQSCAHTIIDSIQAIHATGAYSLYQATICNINSEQTSNYYLEGDYAAYGAKLVCVANKTCNIFCFGYNSCTNFYTECIGSCVIYSARAPITDIAQYEPNATIITTTAFEIDVQLMAAINEDLCNNATSITYDDSDENTQDTIIINTESILCCRGYYSCRNKQIIAYLSVTNQSIICSASYACAEVQNMDTNYGTLFCEGYHSCYKSAITNTNVVYCVSAQACTEATFSKTRYVYCSAYYGCKHAVFISNGTDLNVYLTAESAGNNARIICNDSDICNIICRGSNSCGSTTIICYGICNVTNELGSNYLPTLIIPNTTTAISTEPTTIATTGTTSNNRTEHKTTLDPSQAPVRMTLYPSLSPSKVQSTNAFISALLQSTISHSIVEKEAHDHDVLFLIAVIAVSLMISLVIIYFMVRLICGKCIKPKHVENDVIHMKHNIEAANDGNCHQNEVVPGENKSNAVIVEPKETDEGNPVIHNVELAMRNTRGEGSICQDERQIVVDNDTIHITKGHALSNIQADEFIIHNDE